MTMEQLINAAERTEKRVAAAQAKASEARAKLWAALEPVAKKAVDELNEDPSIPYRFGGSTFSVRAAGEIRIELRRLTTARDGKPCGTEIFDGRQEMPWLEAVRATLRAKLGLPASAKFWASIDSDYYVEDK